MSNDSVKKTVAQFSELLQRILTGDAKAVEAMGHLFDRDCVLEIHGPEPMNGSFHGRFAVQVYCKSLASSASTEVTLPSGPSGRLKTERFSIDETEVEHDKAVLVWNNVLDYEGKAVILKGQTTLGFRGDKIVSWRTVVIDVPAAAPEMLRAGLEMHKLKVMDIGRLALAAWAVV